MKLFECLLLLSFTGLSHAATCAVLTIAGLNPGPFMELCEYEKGDPLVLSCKAVTTDESTIRCKDAIDSEGEICAARIHFQIYGMHETPWKVYTKCPPSAKDISVFVEVKQTTQIHPIFLPSDLTVDRLQIHGGSLNERADSKATTIDLNSLRNTGTDLKHLTINSSEARHLKLTSESLQFRDLESFTLENVHFAGLSSSSINLENVKDFSMINVGVGNQRVSAAAIKWNFDSQSKQCPSGTATFTLEGVKQTRNFEANSIVSKGKECRSVVRRLVVRGSDFFPVIPEKIFRNLIVVDEIDELSFDPIECCDADTSWLFKNTARKTKLSIQCSDLGEQVSNYPESRRDEECKKRNVMPIYLIAIITIGSLALILAIFGSICFFYIVPRQRALHAKSYVDGEVVSSDNHVLEMDSNQTKARMSPKHSSSRSKKRGRHGKPLGKLSYVVKNSSPVRGSKRAQATILKVNSLSDEEGRHRVQGSQMSETGTVRTQASVAASKEAKSGVFQTLA